jgi:hypothetical protein
MRPWLQVIACACIVFEFGAGLLALWVIRRDRRTVAVLFFTLALLAVLTYFERSSAIVSTDRRWYKSDEQIKRAIEAHRKWLATWQKDSTQNKGGRNEDHR